MDSCILCEESLIVGPHGVSVFDNLDFDDFTRYPNTCPSCCVIVDESIAEYRRLGIEIV